MTYLIKGPITMALIGCRVKTFSGIPGKIIAIGAEKVLFKSNEGGGEEWLDLSDLRHFRASLVDFQEELSILLSKTRLAMQELQGVADRIEEMSLESKLAVEAPNHEG